MVPQLTQTLSQKSTRVAAATATKFCVTRRRKSHWELHEGVFRGNLVRGPGDTGSDVYCESIRRPQNIRCLRDNRRITMTRSPTGPAFLRPAMPPAVPNMNHKASSISAMCGSADSHPPNIFDGMTVHQMAVSSPSRMTLAASQRAFVIPPKSTDSKLHHSSDVDVDVPRMALDGLSRSDSTVMGQD
jgi:hypothetical protein